MSLFTAFTVLEHTNAPSAKYAMPEERVYRTTAVVRPVTMTLDCPKCQRIGLRKTRVSYMLKHEIASGDDGSENAPHGARRISF